MPEPRLIDEQAALDTLVAALATHWNVAVDTEFVRESTYYPKLCLVQLAFADRVTAVDCLAGLDLEPLLAALYRPEACWVIHSVRQDLEVLWNLAARMPRRVADTQVAAALLGHAPQVSLGELMSRTLGVELDKSHTRTDWTRRPVADAPLRYALDDVRYLPEVWDRLAGQLEALGRTGWFAEDCARLVATPPVSDAGALWARLRGVQRLGDDARLAALALVEWREREAQRLDRPRRWILSDTLVVEIAARRPATVAELAAVPELPRRFAARAGTRLLAELEHADTRERRAAIDALREHDAPDKAAVKALQKAVADRAAELGIHAEMLATRRDLTAAAAGRPPEHLATGWRAGVLAGVLVPEGAAQRRPSTPTSRA